MELLTIVHSRRTDYLPIIYEFAGKVKRHILFYDHDTVDKAYATELKNSIERFNQKYNISTEIKMVEIDEDSKKDMQQIAEVFKGKSKEVYLNGLGADVALFTVLSSIILSNDGKVIAYDSDDNSYNLITKNGFSNERMEKKMNIEDFLVLMGEELLYENKKEKIEENKEALELLFSDAKRLFKVRFLLKQRKTKELKNNYSKIVEALILLNIVDENAVLKGQEAFVRFGYLFEDFIYLQLKQFDFDDMKVGAKIRFDEQQVKRQHIQITNEFDILTIKDNKIGFVECKMGDSLEPLSTIYKSDSVMEYFGASASSLIVNIERNKTPHVKNAKKNFGASLLYRAKTKKVTIYNAFDFSKNSFRTKIKEAFSVDLKEEFRSKAKQESVASLQDKWAR